MINKKQRIELRSLASTIKPTVWIGKDGFSDNALAQISEELFNHELIKIALQDTVEPISASKLTEICNQLNAEIVTTIGKKIVLYKLSDKKNIKHIIA